MRRDSNTHLRSLRISLATKLLPEAVARDANNNDNRGRPSGKPSSRFCRGSGLHQARAEQLAAVRLTRTMVISSSVSLASTKDFRSDIFVPEEVIKASFKRFSAFPEIASV